MKTPPASGVFDGHSVALVGYKESTHFPGGGYFIFRNSYGEGFGAKGYGFMSYEYAKKYVNDAVAY
jgi:C1A family cysteine protease